MCTVFDMGIIAENKRYHIHLHGTLDTDTPHIQIEDDNEVIVWSGLVYPTDWEETVMEWIARDELEKLRLKCIELDMENRRLKGGGQ
jgi:hypothetical protein